MGRKNIILSPKMTPIYAWVQILENAQTKKISDNRLIIRDSFRDPAGARTRDPNIKSVVLYRLSYRINAHQMRYSSILVVQM